MPVILQYTIVFVGLLAVIAYGYGQWKQGQNKQKLDAITLLEKDVKALREEVEKLMKEVIGLRQENADERKKFADTVLALQGRDPQTLAFVTAVNEYITVSKPLVQSLVTDVLPVVKKLDLFLNKQQF